MSAGWDDGPHSPERPAETDQNSIVTGLDKQKFRDRWLSWDRRVRDKAALFALWIADKHLRRPQAYAYGLPPIIMQMAQVKVAAPAGRCFPRGAPVHGWFENASCPAP